MQKVVRSTVRNLSTGSFEHFLVNKRSMKGCWVPTEQLDLSSLILDLFCRRHRQKEERLKRVIEKKKKIEDERIKRIAEAAMKVEEEKRKREKSRIAAKRKKKEAARKKKLEQKAKKKARISSTINAQEASKLQIQKLGSQPAANAVDINLWKKQIELALKSHELQVEYALQSWTNRGLSSIPENKLVEIRKSTLDQLKRTMDRLRQCNQSVMNDEQMMTNMYYHEKKVALKFQSEKSTVGDMGNDQKVTSAPTGISENKISVSQSSTTSNHVHGHNSNLFSTQNVAPRLSISPVRSSNEQTGQHQSSFGNNNPRKRPVSEQLILEGNFLSRQPIMDQTQSSNGGNQFNKKYGECGMHSNTSGHADFINQPFNTQPQHMPGGFQNQVQSQHLATSASYSTPNSKNGLLDGASSSNNNAFYCGVYCIVLCCVV